MRIIVKTLYGLEKILTGELNDLGIKNVKPVNRAVIFDGDTLSLYKANYCLRTALSVLREITSFRINSADDLYRKSLGIDWEKYLTAGNTFSVVPVVHSPLFSHTGYAGLLLKDAIADWFRNKYGKRPSVDADNADIVFNLHISNYQATVSVDSSVVPLFKRGYRIAQGPAPMNEVLAAGIVLMSGWKGDTPFLDPMCGSGTIPIEAALMACHIPPGSFRSFFGFQRWPDYDGALFEKVRSDCESGVAIREINISCSDISGEAVNNTRINVESAGLSDLISTDQHDFRDLKSAGRNGIIIMNPPYGERLQQPEISELYSMIGTTLKHNFPGFKALLITSDKEALRYVGLKPGEKIILFNGSLECSLVKYDLYEGPRKQQG